MSPGEELRSLLLKARKGREEAFRELVERTRDRLFGAVAAMVRREALAEEILQEAYIALWDPEESGDVENPGAWLYRFCSNRAIDHLRRNEPLFLEDIEGAGTVPFTHEDRPDIVLESREEAELLAGAIGRLPSKERAVLVMSDYLGMTSTEVASALGVSPSTVRNQLASGRRKAIDYFKGEKS